ncbi:MAG: hypothetical protein ACK57K_01585 [Chryseotalea sp.]
MKKRAIILTSIILALVAGAYFITEYIKNAGAKTFAQWVPTQAAIVFKPGTCENCLKEFTESNWLQLATQATRIAINENIQQEFNTLFTRAELVSVHLKDQSGFDAIAYLPAEALQSFTTQLVKTAKAKSIKVRQQNRLLSGLTIQEIVLDKITFSYIIQNNLAAASTSALLIEDVVRQLNEKEKSILQRNTNLSAIPTIKNDMGDVWIDQAKVMQILHVLIEKDNTTPLITGSISQLDVKQEQDALVASGFTLADTTNKTDWLNYFQSQNPVSFSAKAYISNRSLAVWHIGITNPEVYGKHVWSALPKASKDSIQHLFKWNEAEIASLYATTDKEWTRMKLETSSGNYQDIFLIAMGKEDALYPALLKIANNPAADSVYFETYADVNIHQIDNGYLPSLFFPVQKEINQTYFTRLGNVVAFSSNNQALKIWIDDFNEENTWGKTVEINNYLESVLLESNLSFFVDGPRAVQYLKRKLKPSWKQFVDKRKTVNQIGMLAFQYSNLNNQFYTNYRLQWGNTKKVAAVKNDVSITLPAGIAHVCLPVKNHTDKSIEILLQDSTKTLRLLNLQGKELWNVPLNNILLPDAYQVDYLSNGKLQYLLHDGTQLYVIDRLGNAVAGFPKTLPAKTDGLQVIDYDKSRKYRWLTQAQNGTVYMLSKEGEPLEGWNPKKLTAPAMPMPEHVRLAGKDYVVALQKNQQLVLFTRRGEAVKGFPFDLKGRVSGQWFAKNANQQEPAHFVIVLLDGYKVKVDANGKELMRETLVKEESNSMFALVKSEQQSDYVVVRQDNRKTVLLNQEGKTLVTNEFIGLNNVEVKYYDFGNNKLYFTIHDKTQQLAYVYNANGEMLHQQPYNATQLKLFQDGKEVKLLVAASNYMQVIKLN